MNIYIKASEAQEHLEEIIDNLVSLNYTVIIQGETTNSVLISEKRWNEINLLINSYQPGAID